MSSPLRTLRNVWRAGLREFGHQMMTIGDSKAGTLIGVDKFGNKYYEDRQEFPLRTRWVDYKMHYNDASEIEPGWHAWLHYSVDKPPTQDASLMTKTKKWETPDIVTNYTQSRGAYKPYNTTVPKIQAWEPKASPRA